MSVPQPSASSRRYSPVLKVLLVVFVLGLFAVSTATVGATVAVVRAGMIRVKVHEKSPDGTNVRLVVPAILVNLGLAATPMLVPDDAYGEATDELARMKPLLERLAEEIDRCPEGPLVEVIDGEEHVVIALQDRALQVRVDTPTEEVEVTLPISVIKSSLWLLPDEPAGS